MFNFCNLRELNFQKSKMSSYLTAYITYLNEITDLSKGDYIFHYLLLFFPLIYFGREMFLPTLVTCQMLLLISS